MSIIYLNQRHDRLKDYSAVVKGGKSVVTIKIECAEPGSLGFLLECLAEIQREQVAAEKAAKEAARKPKRETRLALPAPLLRIADMREDDL
ncbi:hypothetical protein [Rhizobium sp. SL86]|uniref:hypothetical protein n=1 Tax=Rhizobium sp. SL86 TaxID=2995148 RepID=UPI0022733418|nr:hypothetical protein [Rhizobium sp. SL86]MCY1667878.1 hypothetical protein [Rhizobium sp. SL86]